MIQSRVAYIGMGSNLGDRRRTLEQAVEALGQMEQTRVLGVSDWLETPPLGSIEQPDYLNGVAQLETRLEGHHLLKALQAIEQRLGRQRKGHWVARTLDLDIVLIGGECIQTKDLVVPHPQMHLRSFVLEPLTQLDGTLDHPVLQCSMNHLLARLNGGNYERPSIPGGLIALAGNIGAGKTTLARRLHERMGGTLLLEPYRTNPFLKRVYQGHKEFALDAQLYFLVKRSEQLAPGRLLSGQFYWADYWFQKEMIFARRLLDTDQLDLYERIYHHFIDLVTTPTVVIYLRGRADQCLPRIHQRNRDYEQHIDPAFLEGLSLDYDESLSQTHQCPVIRLEVDTFDSLSNADCDWLVQQLKAYIGPDKA